MQLPPKAIFVFCTDGWHQGLLLDCYLFILCNKSNLQALCYKPQWYALLSQNRVIFQSRQVKGNSNHPPLASPQELLLKLWEPSAPQGVHLETPTPLKNDPPWKCAGFDWNQKNQHNWLVLNNLFRKYTENWESKTLKKPPPSSLLNQQFSKLSL